MQMMKTGQKGGKQGRAGGRAKQSCFQLNSLIPWGFWSMNIPTELFHQDRRGWDFVTLYHPVISCQPPPGGYKDQVAPLRGRQFSGEGCSVGQQQQIFTALGSG